MYCLPCNLTFLSCTLNVIRTFRTLHTFSPFPSVARGIPALAHVQHPPLSFRQAKRGEILPGRVAHHISAAVWWGSD